MNGPAGSAPPAAKMESAGYVWKKLKKRFFKMGSGLTFEDGGGVTWDGKTFVPPEPFMIVTSQETVSRAEGDENTHVEQTGTGISTWLRFQEPDGWETMAPEPPVIKATTPSKPKEPELPEWVAGHLRSIGSAEPLQDMHPNGTFTVAGMKGRYYSDPTSPLDFVAKGYRVYSTGGKNRTIFITAIGGSDYQITICNIDGGWYQFCYCDPQPSRDEPTGEKNKWLCFIFAVIFGALFGISMLAGFHDSISGALAWVAIVCVAGVGHNWGPEHVWWRREWYRPTLPLMEVSE